MDAVDEFRPGPGAYEPPQMKNNGKYIYSKFLNSKCSAFGKMTDILKNKRLSEPSNLGPATYKIDYTKDLIKLSGFKKSKQAVFPTQKR